MCAMVVPTGFGVCLGLGFPVVVVVWLCIMGFVVGLFWFWCGLADTVGVSWVVLYHW